MLPTLARWQSGGAVFLRPQRYLITICLHPPGASRSFTAISAAMILNTSPLGLVPPLDKCTGVGHVSKDERA